MARLAHDRVIVHMLLLIPGILLLAKRVAEYLRKLWEEDNIILGLAPWAGIPTPPKIESIIEYVLLVVTLGALGVGVLWRMHQRSRQAVEASSLTRLFIAYELTGLILALGSWYWGSPELLVGWLVLVLLYPASRMDQQHAKGAGHRVLLIGAGFTIAFGAWVLFTSSWVGQFRFLNDYRDLPEYTVLRDGNLVENREFIAKHRLAGMHAASVCAESEQGVSTGIGNAACLQMKQHPFKSPLDSILFFPPGDGLFFDRSTQTLVADEDLDSGKINKITIATGLSDFDPRLNAFRINAQRTARYDLLSNAVVPESQQKTLASPDSFDERQSNRTRDNAAALERGSKHSQVEIQDFMRRNTLELRAQSHQGKFFHHHAFTYLPILESALSPADRIIPAQYGEGLTRAMSVLLSGTGTPPTFNEYYALLWLFVAAYLILLTFLIWWITGEAWAAITAPGLALAALFLVGSETLRMAPGFNPIRHFPDLLVFAALALQARKPFGLVAILRALSLGFFVWWNREFGLFLAIAALAWSGLDVAAGRDRVNAVRQIVLDLGAVLAVLVVSTNIPSDLTIYNLMGVNTPSIRWAHALAWAALWIPLVGAIAWLRFWSTQSDSHETQGHLLDIAGIGFIYCALASIYPIWNPSRTHAAVIWLCGVGPILCLGVWLTRQRTSWTQLGIRWLGNYALAVMIILLGSALLIDWPDRARNERVFSQHKLFDWNFGGLHAQSTAEPGGIEAAVDLMRRHQPEGRIVLLSRYDSLLQVLSQRIGALPYIDTPTALVSRDLSERVAELILATPNATIFVDHDLLKNREGEIYRIDPKLREISAQRVAGLAVLGATFESIRHCYRPGEIAGVLQVWHRTCPATPKTGATTS